MWLRCLDEFDMFISFVFKPGQLNIVDSLVTVETRARIFVTSFDAFSWGVFRDEGDFLVALWHLS